MIKQEKLQNLISQKENPKLDFKKEWYTDDNLKTELIKDIIALTNGNIHTIGQSSYLIIGVKESSSGNTLYNLELSKTTDDIKKQLLQNLQKYTTPAIQDLDVELVSIESKNIMVISIPFHPYLIILKNKLKHYTQDSLLYRAGEGTVVADYSTRKSFEKAIEKYNTNVKKIDNSTEDSVLFDNWNEKEAEGIIIGEMVKYENIKNNNFGFKKKINHTIISFLEINDINYNNSKKIAIIKTLDGSECHVCGVKLSFVEFINVASGWILGSVHINVLGAGSWGDYNGKVNVLSIGKNKFGVTLEEGYGNQGYWDNVFSLYTIVAGEYIKVLETSVYSDNGGAVEEEDESYYSWDANISFEETENSLYYNLVVLRKGIRDRKIFEEKIIYKFDEITYREIKTIEKY